MLPLNGESHRMHALILYVPDFWNAFVWRDRDLYVLYQFRVLKAARARYVGKSENGVEIAGC